MELNTKHKQLIKRLSDGSFYSGQMLANELGVSRASVWNYLKALETYGFELHAVKGKGTCLESPMELLNKGEITKNLSKAGSLGLANLDVLDNCDSTNQFLLKRNNTVAVPSGSVCIAEMQTAGKGRLGREWISPYGQNVYASFLWRFKSGITSLSGLSLACGVVVCDALKEMGIEGHGLKWPNDILYDGRKLGGILVEIQGENQGEYVAVIGVGLNYKMNKISSTDISQPWIDIMQINNGEIGRNELVSKLMSSILVMLNSYESTGLKAYVNSWNNYDCFKQQRIKIISGKSTEEGVGQGITNSGELKLDKADGSTKLILSGEVSLRPVSH